MMDFVPETKGAFQCREGNILASYTWCPCSPPLCLTPYHPLIFPPLVLPQISVWRINHLQQCVSAVLWTLCIVCDLLRPFRVAAHFSSAAWRVGLRMMVGVGSRRDPCSLQPWATLILFTRDGLHTRAHYLTCRWVARRRGVEACLAAGVGWVFAVKMSGPSRHNLRGTEKMRFLPVFRSFSTQESTSCLLFCLRHVRGSQNTHREEH